MTSRAMKLYAKRRKAKLCTRCGQSAVKNKTMCQAHAEQMAKYRRDRYAAMMAAWKGTDAKA